MSREDDEEVANAAIAGIIADQEAAGQHDEDYLNQWDEERAGGGPPPEDDDHANLWEARDHLAHIRDFARARRVSPLAVLGVVLARVVTHTPPDVVLPALVGGQASLNLFVALVGRSGQGKGGAEAAGMAVLDVPDPIPPSGVGSGEGLPHLFVSVRKVWVEEDVEEGKKPKRHQETKVIQHATAAMLSVPEVDTIAALTNRQGSTLAPELRKAYMGEPLGFQYAALDKRLPVESHGYRLTLLVGVQPGRAGVLLGDVDGGTPQRYLWLPTDDPNAPDDRPPEPPNTLPWWAPDTSHLPQRHGRYEMPVCDTALELVDATRVAVLRGRVEALDTHALLTRLKVAAAFGLLDGRAAVTEDDWRLSALLMGISTRTREQIRRHLNEQEQAAEIARGRREAVRADVAEQTREERAVQRVATRLRVALAAAGDVGLMRGDLRKKITSGDRRYIDDALTHLVGSGIVTETAINPDDPSRRGVRYTASGVAGWRTATPGD